MSTKIEPAPVNAESKPKISMFATKTGFVIPKNKLSGSLVFRGNKKHGGKNTATKSEESCKQQKQRTTKWGPDLTQGHAVKKALALAYQIRIDQITQQLKFGSNLEIGDQFQESSQPSDHDSSIYMFNNEELGNLEVERREAIGELLKLNPTYKAPSDYKPLFKEAKVPIPVKEFPGYNFISLIFGSTNDTQKRLEKETGAKIRVYGIKEDKGEKIEIKASDGNETLSMYKDIYAHVLADTYDEVDAAVSLIELLVTPAPVNPVSSSTASAAVEPGGDYINTTQPPPTTTVNTLPPLPPLPPQPPQPPQLPPLSQPMPARPPPPHHHNQFTHYSNPPWPAPHLIQNSTPTILTNPNNQPSTSSSSSSISSSTMIALYGKHPPNPSPPFQGQLLSNPSSTFQGQHLSNPSSTFQGQHLLNPSSTFQGQDLSNPSSSFQGQQPTNPNPSFEGQQPPNTIPTFQGQRPYVVPLPFRVNQAHNNIRAPLAQSGGPTLSSPNNLPLGRNPLPANQPLNPKSLFRPPPQMPMRASHSSIPQMMTSAPQPSRQFVPETVARFTGVKPHPSSNNFTFQPRQPQDLGTTRMMMPPLPPQNFLARQTQAVLSSRPTMQGFVRQQVPLFQNQGLAPRQMGPASFGGTPLQVRPPLQQNYPSVGSRPLNFSVGPNQLHQRFVLGKQQNYDPFSPTSAGTSNSAKGSKQETDPEYEDLMASVGVQ